MSNLEDAEYWGRMYAVETDRSNKAIEALHRTEAELNKARREICFTIQAITHEQAHEVAASRGWSYLYAPAPSGADGGEGEGR